MCGAGGGEDGPGKVGQRAIVLEMLRTICQLFGNYLKTISQLFGQKINVNLALLTIFGLQWSLTKMRSLVHFIYFIM